MARSGGDGVVGRGVLGGLRVVELGQMVAAPFCAKVLADMGAEVLKVEPPKGDAARRVGPFAGGEAGDERSVLFLHLNTSKESIQLDISTRAGATLFARLVADADVLIDDRPPDAGADPATCHDALCAANPKLVMLSLTRFGLSGPYKDYKATPLTTFHGSGEGYVTPVASDVLRDVRERPPLRQGRFAGEYKLGAYAAILTLAAVFHARATGTGQHID